ncbi:Proline iminopeptidase, variant 2 [Balamuthia mandrillaris]
MQPQEGRRGLYPPIEPYNTGRLKVSSLHEIYYEECGNPNGKPVVVVHGGPGGGIAPYYRQYFDPEAYHIILFDQRGAGQSLPFACLEENTTWDLVSDMEKLREHLGIDTWLLFGGSWVRYLPLCRCHMLTFHGFYSCLTVPARCVLSAQKRQGSTLSLAYAETHPEKVKGLILRGIFTLRRKELLWFYQGGADFLFPDSWEKYIEPIPEVERGDLMSAYYRRLTGNNEEEKLACARAWSVWEMSTSRLYVDPEYIKRASEDDKFALAFARIECHYFVHGGFFHKEGQLIEDAHKIAHLPIVIVQGRYDVVCPATTAWELKKQLPSAKFHFVPDAGHSAKEPGIIHRLVEACDEFRTL